MIVPVAAACSSDVAVTSAGDPALVADTQPTPAVTTSPAPVPSPTPPPAGPQRFSKKHAVAHVRKLAGDIGVRVKATTAETRAARYIRGRFEAFGYLTQVQRFSTDGRTSRNVVAWWPDAKRYPFVIGAHMDTVPGSPGGNDNASGVAVMLETARIFAGTEQAANIRFVAFGAEEYGEARTHHDGSRHYVASLGNKGRNRLAGMLSVDMIANGRPLLVGHSNIARKPIVARTLHKKATRAGIATEQIVLCDCSDHGPFEHAGIPAAFAYSGRDPDYHSPADTVANAKPDDILRTGRAVRAFAKALDKEMLDRFRRA